MSHRPLENRPPGLAAGRYLERLSKALPGKSWSRTSREFWPDGAKLVISISLQFQAGAEPEPAPGNSISSIGDSCPDTLQANRYEYGFKEGIPRLLEVFRRRHVRVTAHMAGSAVERNPQLAREIAERGHEAAAGGHIWCPQTAAPSDEERQSYEATMHTIQRVTGAHPIGFKASCRHDTPHTEVLQDLGFLYHSDDVSRDEPFLVSIRGTPFVVVPGSVITDDLDAYERRFFGTDQYANELKNQFEMLYSESEVRRRMMSVTALDWIAGQPARAKVLEEFIIYAQRRPGIVFMRKDEIARFALSSSITPREEDLMKGREAA